MNTTHPTGLGEPEPVGKKSLFQPPGKANEKSSAMPIEEREWETTARRVRTTIGLTPQALSVIQDIQNRHRLETGRVLPLWKLVSQAVEFYGASQKKTSQKQGTK